MDDLHSCMSLRLSAPSLSNATTSYPFCADTLVDALRRGDADFLGPTQTETIKIGKDDDLEKILAKNPVAAADLFCSLYVRFLF